MLHTIYKSVILFVLLIPFDSIAQNTLKITGRVVDINNNPINGAHIRIIETKLATSTNSKGQFSLSVSSKKNLNILITHVSYQDSLIPIHLNDSNPKKLNITLFLKDQEMDEIKVKHNFREKSITIDAKHFDQFPVSGSGVVEQVIKTLPGVSSNNELSSQYSVRGGNFDENLVYINEIEIYRPNLIRSGQQEGLSIINPDLVSSVQFSSGAYDAKYGDKLSSVLDVRYKTPTKFEASAELSLMGASTHFANASKNGKLSYMTGIRYKTNRYLLNSLDTKGEYEPKYTDVQAMLNYKFNSSISLHVWTNFSRNDYNFIPKNRSTSFGTINDALNLDIYFDGNEKDEFNSNLQAITFKYHPNSNSFIRLIGSRYESIEEENYDIIGQYYLSDLFVSQGGSQSESIENLGIGTFIDHARNKLNQEVYSVDFKGDHSLNNLFLQWGIGIKSEDIKDKINEWQYQDSAGYSIPISDSEVLLAYNRNANNILNLRHYRSFIQGTQILETNKGEIQITAGLRYHYWDYNKKGYFSPRASIHYLPDWKNQVKFRLSAGLYQQIPSYREMIMINGNISTKINVQKAIHYVLAQEYYFKAWDRPFKFTSELYYKHLLSVTPYDIENVRIRYYGNQEAKAYAAGLDLRINGEFVAGTESWASLSFLKTEEDIRGDNRSFVPRPSDQRFKFSMFFQDYVPNNPSYKMHLALTYAGKLPVWTPKQGKSSSFRMPNYRRIDLGFSKVLVDEKTRKKGLVRHFKSMWIGLEVFNVLDINNTVSYLWIKDISGNQYAIPNYLTGRKLNLKLSAKF
ncbi:TonB-dependent receptor [Marinifilum sp.]|uniref:TonB-dependent receptor n=1 Tax=Marinifilum sp. TaxID=2033137 RepID=UPI003BAC6AB9